MKIGKGTKIWYTANSNIHTSVQIGDNCVIHSHVWIGEGVKIGNNVKIQAFTFIPTGVIIEDNVFIGPRVTFTNDKNPPSGKANWKETIVRAGASIGASCTILPGVEIGSGAKVGAASLVTRSISDNCLAYGSPAEVKVSALSPAFNPEHPDHFRILIE